VKEDDLTSLNLLIGDNDLELIPIEELPGEQGTSSAGTSGSTLPVGVGCRSRGSRRYSDESYPWALA
jgi:hypothetical protein